VQLIITLRIVAFVNLFTIYPNPDFQRMIVRERRVGPSPLMRS